jgi:hypothetical protein
VPRRLGAQPERAADEGIFSLVEPKSAVGGPRDSDPRADADCAGRTRRSPEPDRACTGAEVNAIEALVYFQRLGKTPRAAGEIEQARYASVMLHPRNPVERLERSDQDSRADAGNFTRYVEEPARSVRESHVRGAASEKKRIICGRVAGKGVPGGVAHRIPFRLDDSPAQPALRQIVDQRFTDQKARELDRIHGQLGAAKTPEAADLFLGCAFVHRIAALAAGQFASRADEAASRLRPHTDFDEQIVR